MAKPRATNTLDVLKYPGYPGSTEGGEGNEHIRCIEIWKKELNNLFPGGGNEHIRCIEIGNRGDRHGYNIWATNTLDVLKYPWG